MMKNNSRLVSYILVIIPVIFWGISFISTKVVLEEIPPVSIAFFRQIIALVPLAGWCLFTGASFRIKPKDVLLLAISCFFGIVLYFVFENNGLRYTTASSASMIVAAVPVFTLLTEAALFKTGINRKAVICILISIAGVYLVISENGKLDLASSTFFGSLLIMGAMVSWVIYTILSRDLGTRYTSLQITTFQTAISIFLFIPFTLPEIGDWHSISSKALLNLIYLGVFCSAVSYLSFLYAIKKLGPTQSSAFLNLIPVVSVAAGYLILGERLAVIQFAGMALIILSLFKLNSKPQA
jgi:drug/metabolite transporter (DMT)-like permease